ncbi:MAG: TrkH family potassium uptake protein [Clostridiales bacterium]|nr:TrkH family potassium uptake protein [Clostridiales bacterium]
MNLAMICYILSWAVCLIGLFLLPSCVVALFYQETVGLIYLAVAAVYIAVGLLLTRRKPASSRFYAKDGYVTVALTWMLASILGAVPFTLAGDIPSFLDAVFETASGFTTTGSTILTDIESVSHASLFWRAFTQWLGGMGILVFLMAILPLSSGRNIHLMRAESTGASVEKMVPKIKESATLLYKIYGVLTLSEMVLLLFGGMSFFEAITTSFTSGGTGGFGVLNTSMSEYSPYIQYVVTIFQLLFGVNFGVYFLLLARKFKAGLLYEELRWYLLVIAVATALVMWDIRSLFPTLEEVFRHSFFQVVTIMTTTGYMSTDFSLWPSLSQAVLVLLMFIGACAGSTGGGMKISRWLLMGKYVRCEAKRLRHPRVVYKIRLNGSAVSDDILRQVLFYLVAYVLIFVASLMLISLEGYDLVTSFTSVATTYNNVGPGLSLVGPTSNFAFYSPLSKLVLIFDMLAGRLEVLPLVVLLSAMGEKCGSVMKRVRKNAA